MLYMLYITYNFHFSQVDRRLGKATSLSESIDPKQPGTSISDKAAVTKPNFTEGNSKPFQRRYINQGPEGSNDTHIKSGLKLF